MTHTMLIIGGMSGNIPTICYDFAEQGKAQKAQDWLLQHLYPIPSLYPSKQCPLQYDLSHPTSSGPLTSFLSHPRVIPLISVPSMSLIPQKEMTSKSSHHPRSVDYPRSPTP